MRSGEGAGLASSTVEDYLKQLYLQQHAGVRPEAVATGRLAAALAVTPGTVTTMLKALAASGLVTYETRRGAQLTPGGERLALHVLRRHRLTELFLVEVLGLDWSVVHEEAERLEHAVSDRVLDAIDALLGHPTTDPHGDPIPTASGHVEAAGGASLAEWRPGAPATVVRVLDQDPVFLRFVEAAGLSPGAEVTVAGRDEASGPVLVTNAMGVSVSLGREAARVIRVAPLRPNGNGPPKRPV